MREIFRHVPFRLNLRIFEINSNYIKDTVLSQRNLIHRSLSLEKEWVLPENKTEHFLPLVKKENRNIQEDFRQRFPPDSHYFPSLAHTIEDEYIVRKLNMLLV